MIQTIPIMIDKERHLLYNWSAFMKAELELTKLKGRPTTALEVFKSMTETADEQGNIDFSKISMTDLLVLVWSGLLHEDPRLKLEDLGDKLIFSDLFRIITAVTQAISVSLPQDEVVEDVPLDQAQ